jgi:hypothetical protein
MLFLRLCTDAYTKCWFTNLTKCMGIDISVRETNRDSALILRDLAMLGISIRVYGLIVLTSACCMYVCWKKAHISTQTFTSITCSSMHGECSQVCTYDSDCWEAQLRARDVHSLMHKRAPQKTCHAQPCTVISKAAHCVHECMVAWFSL